MAGASFGVAAYPSGAPGEAGRLRAYIKKAHALGCREVFSSLHIPELGFADNMAAMLDLSEAVHAHSMQLSLDLSGGVARALLADRGVLEALRALRADWLRLDFGFAPADVHRLLELLAPPGLMLNASVLQPGEVHGQVRALRAGFPALCLRAHHNYYPMPGTGLSLAFMARRAEQFAPYHIPVTACVASHAQPRLPLGRGLPTVEAHRTLPPGVAATRLLATGAVADILLADPFAGDAELADVAACCAGASGKAPRLRVCPAPGLTAAERQILFGRHTARPDEAAYCVRSLTSRQMAAPGRRIAARGAPARACGDIVIGNELALRYTGELQVMRRAAPQSPCHNLAGRVCPADLWMLALLAPGTDFYLDPMEEETPC